MGRKGSWFSSVKKIFVSDPRKDQKHHSNNHRSKLGCFGHHDYHELGCFGHPERREQGSEVVTIAAVPSLPRRRETRPTEAENEQSKQAFSLVLATAVAAGAAVVAAAEVARLQSTPRVPEKPNEEVAATKIQTAYRGFLARRKLRGLRGLARLKSLIQGQSVKRQAATTLQCMQTLSKLQSQVHARRIRMSEENQALQRQLQQKREKEIEKFEKLQAASQVGDKWDDSLQTKEQIEARLVNKQVAAMRREKALAYAMTHQQTWRNPSKSANATFMDPNNPHWGWNWLERWMAARPWEGQGTVQHNEHDPSENTAGRSTMSLSEITKLYALRDQNTDPKNPPSALKTSRPRSHNSPSTQASSKSSTPRAPLTPKFHHNKTSSSPKVSSWGGDDDSNKKNTFGIKPDSSNWRRHSIAASPVRDDEGDESLIASHTTAASSTRVAATRTRSKVQTGAPKSGTSEKGVGGSVSAKKRLSFPSSPSSAAGSRRHSVPNKVGVASSNNNKNVATNNNTEEKVKVKVRNGGSR